MQITKAHQCTVLARVLMCFTLAFGLGVLVSPCAYADSQPVAIDVAPPKAPAFAPVMDERSISAHSITVNTLQFAPASLKSAAAAVACDAAQSLTVPSGTSRMYNVLFPTAPYAGLSDSTTCYMNRTVIGSTDAVRALQSTLNYCYNNSLVVDGLFGALTSAALARAQAAEGITADGKYGPQTRDNIHWKVVGESWCWQKY